MTTQSVGRIDNVGATATLSFTRRFDATIDEVWDALTNPARRTKWLGETILEPREGGPIEILIAGPPVPNDVRRVTGRVLVWDPPHVLEHEWNQDIIGQTVVRYELEADGDGTLFRLTHRGLRSDDAAGFATGTHAFVDRLEALLSDEELPSWPERFAEVETLYLNGRPVPAVRVERMINAPPERVFDAFVQMGTWWPTEMHLGPGELGDVIIEPRTGGRWYEQSVDGAECEWGQVIAFDAPNRIELTWQIGLGFVPQDDSELASHVEISFEPVDADRTRLTLVHSQFEKHGDGWEAMKNAVDGDEGWSGIIDHFIERQMNDAPGDIPARGAIRFERMLPGPIDRIWKYLVDSELRGRWLATGDMPRTPGETFNLRFVHADLSPIPEAIPDKYSDFANGCDLPCRLTAIEPPHMLRFLWTEGTEVTFRLTEVGERVRLVLIHEQIDDSDMIDVASGWHTHLGILVDNLEGRTPKPFWHEHTHFEERYEERLNAPTNH